LTLTNIVLGMAVLAFVVAAAIGIIRDRVAPRRRSAGIDGEPLSASLRDLGITMQDGGERLDEKELHPGKIRKRGDNGPEKHNANTF
jgi:hypothetical protein